MMKFVMEWQSDSPLPYVRSETTGEIFHGWQHSGTQQQWTIRIPGGTITIPDEAIGNYGAITAQGVNLPREKPTEVW